jgi:hypothetical protein
MSDPDRSPRFSLAYELQPSDLAEFYRADRARRRRRAGIWAAFGRIHETEPAFILQGAKSGRPVCALPKRGLARPDQIPALRMFLEEAVGARSRPQVSDSTTEGRLS